jgi:hypothetical protein
MTLTPERAEQVGPYSKVVEGSPPQKPPKEQSTKPGEDENPLTAVDFFQTLLAMSKVAIVLPPSGTHCSPQDLARPRTFAKLF